MSDTAVAAPASRAKKPVTARRDVTGFFARDAGAATAVSDIGRFLLYKSDVAGCGEVMHRRVTFAIPLDGNPVGIALRRRSDEANASVCRRGAGRQRLPIDALAVHG